MSKITCIACSGSGRLDWYAHIDNGVCYACAGTGLVKSTAEVQRSAWNRALDMLDTLLEKGWLTEAQEAANREWCIRKHKAGVPSTQILESVQRSYDAHRAKRSKG